MDREKIEKILAQFIWDNFSKNKDFIQVEDMAEQILSILDDLGYCESFISKLPNYYREVG